LIIQVGFKPDIKVWPNSHHSLTLKNWVTPKDGAKPDLFDPTNRPCVGVTKTTVMIVMNFVILFGCFSQQISLKVKYNA